MSTLTLVLTVLIIQVTAAAPASAAVLVVAPGVLTGGLPATVTGSGFEDETVKLCWDKEGCGNLGEETPVLGVFSTAITIPEGATSGQHVIYACQSGACSSAVVEVVGSETTLPPVTTTTISEPTTTFDPTSSTTTTSIAQATTTTPNPTTTLFGSTTSQPSTSPSWTAGPIEGPTEGPGTTLVGPTPAPIFRPTPPPPVVGSPATSLPGINETSDSLAEDQDQVEDDQDELFGGSDADPPTAILDSVLTGVFTVPETSSDGATPIGPLDDGSPIPEASSDPDPRPSENRSIPDFPMPDLGVWGLWVVFTVGLAAAALAFDAVRQRRHR